MGKWEGNRRLGLEWFDLGLLGFMGAPLAVTSVLVHMAAVHHVSHQPLGVFDWAAAMLSQLAFVACAVFASLTLLSAASGTRMRTPARGAWVLLALFLVTLDFYGRAAVFVQGTTYDARALGYVYESWGELKFVAATIVDTSSVTSWLVFGSLGIASLIGYLSFRTPVAPVEGRRWVRTGVHGVLAVIALSVAQLRVAPLDVPQSVSSAPLVYLAHSAQHPRWQALAVEPEVRRAPALSVGEEPAHNLVVITLESVGRRSTSLGEMTEVTPNLAALARRSGEYTRAYASVPHSTKAMVPMMCGVHSWLSHRVVEVKPGGLRTECLPQALGEVGYRSGFLRSATGNFEGWTELIEGMGFDTALFAEDLPYKGFELVNIYGYEDDILLEPAREWLQEGEGEPFFLVVNTGTSHHAYDVPSDFPKQTFSQDPEYNKYLNSVAYVDRFVGKFMTVLEEEGHADDTVVVILGDHGESFSHPQRFHNLSLYEDVVAVPFVVVEPGATPFVSDVPISQTDLAGTAIEAMGLEAAAPSTWPSAAASSVSRPVFSSCWHVRRCVSVVRGDLKLIHHFGDLRDQLYDVEADPLETTNLIEDRPADALELRGLLDAWYAQQQGWARWQVEHFWE